MSFLNVILMPFLNVLKWIFDAFKCLFKRVPNAFQIKFEI